VRRAQPAYWVALLTACGGPPEPTAPASVPVVAIGDEPGEAPAARTPETFACRPPRVGDSAVVELVVHWSATTSQQTEEVDSRAAYTMQILELADGEFTRATVKLERLEPERLGDRRRQMAWHTAVEQGWVEPQRPFELAKLATGQRWCFSEAGHCTSGDTSANEFANALGESLSLVVRPELAVQLEGKPSDGNLKLELSEALRKRASLGVVDDKTQSASQQGSRFPAVFRFPLRDPAGDDESEARRDLAAKLKIDRACRVLSLTTVLRTDRRNYEGFHELTWRIHPEW